MPIIRVNGAALYYEEYGTGPETIVFAHGLLWSCRMFDAKARTVQGALPLRGLRLPRPGSERGDTQWLRHGDPLRVCGSTHRTTRLRALPLSRPFDGRLHRLASRRQAPRASAVADPAGDFR